MGPEGQPLPTRQGSHGRGLLIGVALVIGIGAWYLFSVARAVSNNPDAMRRGSNFMEVSRDEATLVKRVSSDGPRLYPGVGNDIDVWLNRVNDQWFAFSARQPGTSRDCNARWNATNGVFDDGCVADATYGPTGQGLPQFEVIVEERVVSIKLTAEAMQARSSGERVSPKGRANVEARSSGERVSPKGRANVEVTPTSTQPTP
jgi:hypothetical protein